MTPEGVDEALHKYNEIKSDLEYITTEAAKMREKMQLPTSEAAAFEYYLKTGKTTLDSVGGAINTDAIKMSDLTTQTSLAADQAERLASALNQSGGAGGGAGGGDFSGDAGGGGDFQYAASGGVARRGTDTIPAMLSPGERVMNAASSRQFSSQLQSMNSGMLPVPRSQSGSVTNIGDINVSVKGGDNTHQTAREIAQVLRREIRRGTSRLN